MTELSPAPFEALLGRMFDELERTDSIFDLPRSKFWAPSSAIDASVRFHGQRAATPIGPAAGPHTQLAQNIVLSWLGGSRLFELKTVQINDQLTIPRPCIDVQTIGFNVEWSQELRIAQSIEEYVSAWMLIHGLMARGVPGLPAGAADFIFDASVGYDLAGIRTPQVTGFLKALQDASATIERLRARIPDRFADLRDIEYPTALTRSVTLSTFHGCPAGEIEGIVHYLLTELDLDVVVKMNPTLLGYEALTELLHDQLGYTTIEVPRDAFEHDLKWDEAVDMMRRLLPIARKHGRTLGAKFTNTLIVNNNRGFFPASEAVMYMSGQPLHVIAMQLVARWREVWAAEMPISFSAGIEARNFAEAVACDLRPITVCTDLLRPGGYGRLPRMIKRLEDRMEELGAHTVDDYIVVARGGAAASLAATLADLDTLAAAHLDATPEALTAFASAARAHLEAALPEALAARRPLSLAAWLGQELGAVAGSHGLTAAPGGLADALHERWARAAGCFNTAAIVPGLANDRAYTAARNSKPPNMIASKLALFDCISCDKCVPVCPNDANFTYDVPTEAIPFAVLDFGAAEVGRTDGGQFQPERLHQIGNFADFCNCCGNCDVYCPEQGAPYVIKPRFFVSLETWRADAPSNGFHIEHQGRGDVVHGRFAGATYRLQLDAAGHRATFADDAVEVDLDLDDQSVLGWQWRPRPDGGPAPTAHTLSLEPLVIMRTLRDAVLARQRINPVNATAAVAEIPRSTP